MSELSKHMRHRRFTLVDNSPVQCVIESATGSRITLQVKDASLTGIGGETSLVATEDPSLSIGSLLTSTKLTVDGKEIAMGRMVVRNCVKKKDGVFFGLSMVDARVPIDGALSRFLVGTTDEDSAFSYELSSDKFSLANFRESNDENVDLFGKTKKYGVFFREWEKSDWYGPGKVRLPSMGARVSLKARQKNGRNDFLIMGSNDYLGLASHPEAMEAAKDAIDKYGFGSTGSPLTTGVTEIHEELCALLASMYRKQKVILFNSGYAANVGTISGLIQSRDLVISDMIAHASIQDGMAMSQGTSRFYKHNNVSHLTEVLKNDRHNHCGGLLITEGVFSMDGDIPPLDEIIRVAKEFKCRTFVDEAHSMGVIGPKGLGACEKFNVMDQVDIIMGTFSKIGGGIGGFIATETEVADWLYWLARSHMFSVSIPPSTAAAVLTALKIFIREPNLVQQLQKNIKHFAAGLRHLGFAIPLDHESAVLPAVIGETGALGIINRHLMDNGVFTIPVPYPAVSRSRVRFRFTVMANHTVSDLDFALTVLEQGMKKAGFNPKDRIEKA